VVWSLIAKSTFTTSWTLLGQLPYSPKPLSSTSIVLILQDSSEFANADMGVAKNLLRGQTRGSGGQKSPAGSRGRMWKPTNGAVTKI